MGFGLRTMAEDRLAARRKFEEQPPGLASSAPDEYRKMIKILFSSPRAWYKSGNNLCGAFTDIIVQRNTVWGFKIFHICTGNNISVSTGFLKWYHTLPRPASGFEVAVGLRRRAEAVGGGEVSVQRLAASQTQ